MNRPRTIFALTIFLSLITLLSYQQLFRSNAISGAPPYDVSQPAEVPQSLDPFDAIRNWKRPVGPARVGLQIGHWQNTLAPEELKNLRRNNGASAAGINEVDINYQIAHQIKSLLENHGVQVDILPTTIPPDYWADVFMAIHADGNEDASVRGFKFAGPWRDFTGKSTSLIAHIEPYYKSLTKLPQDPSISKNMRGYYAFSWWKYDHAIHPHTVAVIAETGFVSNPQDRQLLTNQSHLPAQAIAQGILDFLNQEQLL